MLNHGQHPLIPLNIGINRYHVHAAKELVQSMSNIMQKIRKHFFATHNRQNLMLIHRDKKSLLMLELKCC